ncbi:dnaJ-like protein subfamily C member 13 isoform X2 [Trypanosoma conorhini]|uniref:DnaJ-like protein subfamily C member 13 isoform X2 n=1 Tax=Trypanosoma conorhini TaxID=83891 RepID=A0A422Q8Y8_9TRYP|nr:dnaJ-like protein subfamily C member 13 isoform X2 [Trypanosoma conorhini]RNF26400.1 dnaJ-like protein subfamily C member 13 isoform X2 [Trypanosoma conorhini]
MDAFQSGAPRLAGCEGAGRRPSEEYTSRYTVVKNSWKGSYMRIFCIGPQKVATINPQSIFRVTNSWDYTSQLVDVVASAGSLTGFTVTTGRTGKPDTMNFHCNTAMERAALLTDVQRNRPIFDVRYRQQAFAHLFFARKYCFDEGYRNCRLRITNVAVEQLNHDGNVVGVYLFMHIKGLTSIQDNPRTLVVLYGPQLKMHLYEMDDPQQVVSLTEEFARRFIGLPPFRKVRRLTQQQFDTDRLGVDRAELAPTAEFPVMKWSSKHPDTPVRRTLATTQKCLLELDSSTYTPVSVFFFADVCALIRSEGDNQGLMLQFKEPAITKRYTSPMRDALLAHLVDCCRGARNLNVCVITNLFDRGKRAAPCGTLIPEEIESTLLNCLIDPSKGGGAFVLSFPEVVEFFNANIEYSGLRFTENREGFFAENREKMIFSALVTLLSRFPVSDDPLVVVQQFYALRRLCVTRIGFSSAAVVPSFMKSIQSVSVRALKMNNVAVSHAVIDFLGVLMTPHHDHYELGHEKANKNHLLGQEQLVQHLLRLLSDYTTADSAALVVQALLDFFVYALCPPYSESTEATLFVSLMNDLVDTAGTELLVLMQHSCNAISYSAGQLIRVIMEEGTSEQFFAMQLAALRQGGILGQLHLAIFGNNREIRDLARQLIAYWTYQNTDMQDLLRCIFPPALLHYLQSSEDAPEDEKEKERQRSVVAMTDEFWESKIGLFRKRFHPSEILSRAGGQHPSTARSESASRRHREVKVKTTLNWPMFFYEIKQDHMRAELIWNHTTRTELRAALEAEMQALKLGMSLRQEEPVSWNYREFEVRYPSLDDELKIGQHYPRLLFEMKDAVISKPKDFFNDMYHRFLLSQEPKTKLSCLHGMSILYEHYAAAIGQFNDLEYILKMLETTMDPNFRDRLLLFILQLLRARPNVKLFLDCGGLNPLVDLLTLAHLHVDRPQLRSATSAIEHVVSPGDLQDQEKEWYYTKDGVKQDPVSYTRLKQLYEAAEVKNDTKVWAQGLPGWMELKDVPQLRWGIVASKSSKLLTLSEVSGVVLDIFSLLCAGFPSRDEHGAIMQPPPRVKRFLSGPQVLPHVVQLLLTFDPALCARVHSLLYLVMEYNPLMPRFFLTGVFFFALMYTGSDILPLCRLLHLSHRRQAFRLQHDNEIISQSILSTMLPPALVCFLTNHGPQRFADILLGEYETPEAIWGKDMRRYLVGKIAAHVADFTPRLLGNNRAVYQYCPIVGVVYEPLRDELFCSQYYLRHFCDELRYPNWPVEDPVSLLCEVLKAWRRELAKQSSGLTRDGCLEELEIVDRTNLTPQVVRKAYFRLAAQYHPDKNSEGRDKFERVQRAYEFLASDARASNEPNPHNVALLLRTQSILFRRFSDAMRGYKYAGYGLLLKLVSMEYGDPEMLHKDVVLIEPATELCYFTVQNVPLNTDELQEEGGIELLSGVTQRCFETLTLSATDDLNQVKVARHCMLTFCVAAAFPDCRRHIIAEPAICHLAAKGIAYEKAPALSRACIQACQAFCVDETLQERVLKSGAIWHLLLFLFRYDYTLHENGLELQEEHHTQLFANRAAIYALQAIYALAGICPSDAYLQTKPNAGILHLLQKLLTPYVVQRMRLFPGGEKDVLQLLNSNHKTPYLLWDNTTREELMEVLKANSEKCREAGMFSEDLPSLSDCDVRYSVHRNELIVGGMFVRVYNEQPSFAVEDPVAFCGALIKFLEHQLTNNTTTGVAVALEALKNLLVAYAAPGVLSTLAQHVEVLIKGLLYTDVHVIVKLLELLEKAALHCECLQAIGKVNYAMAYLILAWDHGGEAVEPRCLAFLRAALADRGVVQQTLDRGLYAVLLRSFGTATLPECRDDACASLAKACSDKLCGPKMFLRASKLVPSVILEMMKENTVNACQLFDTWQETPELVWTSERRSRFVEVCKACQSDIVDLLRHDPTAYWKMPENILMEGTAELQLGGVYLERYLNQPGWKVRKPKEFLAALLERFLVECGRATEERNAEVISLIADSGVRLLQMTPTVTDYVVSLGYAHKLFNLLELGDRVVAENALKWVHEICASRFCVESLGNFDPVSSILICLRAQVLQLPLIMDTMDRLLSWSSELANMIRLALRNQLPQYLLQLLEEGITPETCGDQSPAAVRALIIKTLKTMVAVQDPFHGPQLEAILSESKVWVKYKNQSHDLFLSDTRFGGYLEGPHNATQMLLSLTAAPLPDDSNGDEPPPL